MNNEELTQQLLSEFNRSIGNQDNNSDEYFLDVESNGTNDGRITYRYTWIEGLREGSRLVWVPTEECIYYSNAVSKKHDNAIACTCFVDECTERIYILNDGTAVKDRNSSSHTHCSLYNFYKERYLYTFMKQRCRTAPTSALIRDIYNEAVAL